MMGYNKINLASGKLFPIQFQWLAFIFLFFGTTLLFVNPIVGVVLLLPGGLILTSFSGFEIDFKNKKYRRYNSFFRFKFGQWQELKPVAKIYINKIKTSQKMYSQANLSSTLRGFCFKSYIKFSNEERVFIVEKKDKNNLIELLQPLATSLKLEIIDNSAYHSQ